MRIPWRYPVTELIAALVFLVLFARIGANWYLLPASLVTFLMLCAALIDLEFRTIPNRIVLAGLVTVGVLDLVRALTTSSLSGMLSSFAGFVVVGVVLLVVSVVARGGFGMGDVKLAALGAAAVGPLGFRATLYFVLLSFAAGSLVGLALVMSGRATRKSTVPFGPFLAFGFVAASVLFR